MELSSLLFYSVKTLFDYTAAFTFIIQTVILHAAAQDHCTAIIAHLERDTEILYVAEIVVAELLLDKKVERIKIAEGNNQFEIED